MSKKDSPSWDQGICFRVLGYSNPDGTWSAHCLETDLIGHGKTAEEALENLVELTSMQISFAQFKKEPHLLYHPAPPQIFEIYMSLLASELQNFSLSKKTPKDRMITNIPFSHTSAKANFANVSL